MDSWIRAAKKWHSPTRAWVALAALLVLLLVGIATTWTAEEKAEPKRRTRLEINREYVLSCGELASTRCPLQELVGAAYNAQSRDGPLTIVEFEPASGSRKELSLQELGVIARAELTSDALQKFEAMSGPSELIASNRLARYRFLDVVTTDRPSDLAAQSTIKQYLSDRRPLEAPVVMLIGDSIRMRRSGSGYGVAVYNKLSSAYAFEHIPHNTGSTSVVLRQLDGWLKRQPDVVLLNAGLHDLVRHDGRYAIPPEEYRDHLLQIYEIVIAHEVKRFSFVLSTPVIDAIYVEKAAPGQEPVRRNSDVLAYNKIMSDVARELDVPLIDLYSPLKSCLERCIRSKDGVHLSGAGAERAADVIARAIVRLTETL